MEKENKTLILKQTNLVAKANSFIEATYKLGVMEQKVISAIASNISPTDKDFQTYTFSIKDFKELLGNKSKSIYSDVDRVMKNLMQPFMFINAEGKPTRIAWLSKSTYNLNEGTVTVRFDPDLKPFFLFLGKKFTSYKLGNIVHLRSSYSIRMYELLKSYEGITTRTFELDELRAKLGVSDTYPNWINFRQRVLDHAQAELAEKTDIIFTYEPIKKGRSFHKVKFTIKRNPNAPKALELQDKIESVVKNEEVVEIQKEAINIGITLSDKIVSSWLQYGKENILKVLEDIKFRDDIEKPIGYISAVLKNMAEDKKAKDEENSRQSEPKSIEQIRIEIIKEFMPQRKVKRAEYLMDWQIKDKVLPFLEEIMTEDEALEYWAKHGEEIAEEINERRKKAVTS